MQPFANNSLESILKTLMMKSIKHLIQNLASKGDTEICLKKREYLQTIESIKSLKARIVVAVLYPGGMPREKLPCRRLEDNTPKETLQHHNNNNNPDVFLFYWGKVHYLACSQNSKIRFFFWALVAIFREGIERDKGEYGGEHYTNLNLELLHSTRIHLTCQCKHILFNGFNGWSVGNKIRLVNSLIRIE